MNLVICSVNLFNGEPDKNGMQPVILTPVSGKCPERRVISGTVAQNLGLKTGETFLLSYERRKDHEIHGAQYQWNVVKGNLTATDIIGASESLGTGQVVKASVTTSVEVEN